MRKVKKNSKEWNIILSSGPDETVRRLRLSKKLILNVIGVIILLPIIIIGLTLQINNMSNQKKELYTTIQEKESQIELKDLEIASAKHEYNQLQEEALAVQLTIEEFKEFESTLNQLDLEMPTDIESDGSGGEELPKHFETGNVAENLIEMRDELPKLIDSFEETVERIVVYEEELRTIPTLFPAAEGRITSQYGNRRDPFTSRTSFHSGIDLAAPINTSIYATADGQVTFAGTNGGYGLSVMIEHDNGYETRYAHLNEISVNVGDEVKKGDVIGGMGTTGRSTGVHLHYEIFRNGEIVDPYLYMTFHQRDTE